MTDQAEVAARPAGHPGRRRPDPHGYPRMEQLLQAGGVRDVDAARAAAHGHDGREPALVSEEPSGEEAAERDLGGLPP